MSKLRVVAIGEYPMISGYALAGVSTIETDSRAEAVARLTDVVSRGDAGVVLAERRVIDALPEPVRRRLTKQAIPIVLALPSPSWTEGAPAAGEQILDLLQRAIGYRVRLQ